MANYVPSPPTLTGLFHALGDATRCDVVGRLAHGPESVSALKAPFEMALPSFMKHLAVLERTGLVRSLKTGRTRVYELVPGALNPAEQWLAEQREQWESRSDRMAAFAEQISQEGNNHDEPNE